MEQYLPEGAFVAYVGDSDEIAVGDRGRVVSTGAGACHVSWKTGAREGEITFHPFNELVLEARARTTDDSLDSGGLVTFAVRDTLDENGTEGLLNAMNAEGHLGNFGNVAEEAIALIANRVRQDPSFIEICAQLDNDEYDALIALATSTIIRDAFGGE